MGYESDMIEIRHVTKVFNKNRPNEFTALHGVSLDLKGNRAIVFSGPSGSGKTTLLSIIGGMAKPTQGRIFVQGEEISRLSGRFLTEVRRRTFGFIFQQLNLIRGMTALENVMLPGYPTGERRRDLRKRAIRLFETLNLGNRAEAKVEWLSGGEAQRVAIARALINDPSILIADEPTAHLDSKLSQDFMGIMERLKEGGKTIILASHDPIVCGSRIVERLVRMRDGLILGQEVGE
ncbi:MAG TPA: ABC transporter ATP-binding protein [Methanoregulaceae archaeon]|jgi:putative ABC transport system ATP-binding protein|nr:ABC transporter ATP-binding protein [Methanoregulaceae archaeon]